MSRELQISILKHDHGVLAPALQDHGLQSFGRGVQDLLARRRRASEADHIDIRVARQLRADVAVALQEVDES